MSFLELLHSNARSAPEGEHVKAIAAVLWGHVTSKRCRSGDTKSSLLSITRYKAMSLCVSKHSLQLEHTKTGQNTLPYCTIQLEE